MPAELLTELAKRLVDRPEAVRGESIARDGDVVLRLHVDPDDVGQVIGRNGRTVNALRTLMRACAVDEGQRVLVDVVD